MRLAGSNSPCEDRYAIRTREDLGVAAFIVIDGHGGNLAADIACSQLIDLFCKRMEGVPEERREPETLATLLDKSFAECDNIILNEAMRIKGLRQHKAELNRGRENVPPMPMQKPIGRAGCCALVMLIHNNIQYFAHVGDCRAVMTSIESAPSSSSSPSHAGGGHASPVAKSAKTEHASGPRAMTGVGDDGPNFDSAPATPKQSVSRPNHAGFCQRDYHLEEARLSPHGSSGSGRRSRHKRLRDDSGEHFFVYSSEGLLVQSVTSDHCCESRAEAQTILASSSDPNPIRTSVSDKRLSKAAQVGPLRVAGSLAVTRALGDGYLKTKTLSGKPYSDYCPYITCRPTIRWRELRPTDKAVVLASDGLWNFVSAKDVADIMREVLKREADARPLNEKEDVGSSALPPNFRFESHMPQDTSKAEGTTFVEAEGAKTGEIPGVCSYAWRPPRGVAETDEGGELDDGVIVAVEDEGNEEETKDAAGALLHLALRKSAQNSHLPLWRLKEMPAGDVRRRYVDDITVMVISLRFLATCIQ